MARKKDAWQALAEAAQRLGAKAGVPAPTELREQHGDFYTRMTQKAELLAGWLDEIAKVIPAKKKGGDESKKNAAKPKDKLQHAAQDDPEQEQPHETAAQTPVLDDVVSAE